MSLTISSNPIMYTQKPTNSSKSVNYSSTPKKETTDTTAVINNNSPQANLAKLKRDGLYRPEEKVLFGLIKKEAQYTYKADGKECIAEIKEKFGLKDGAIKECNPQIRDDDWVPPKDYEIFFYEKDANYNK